MASIRPRSANSWQLVVELGYDTRGRRKQKYRTVVVEDPALLRAPRRLQDYLNTELAKFQMEVESKVYISPEKKKFYDFLDEWARKFVLVELEVNTRDNYLFQAERRIGPYFGHMRIDQIKTMHILDYMEFLRTPDARLRIKGDEPLGSATLVYNYRVLRSIFGKAMEWNVLKENPMAGVKKPKEQAPEMKYYDEHEIQELFEALETEHAQNRLIITLAVTTGMRRGEMAGLEWSRIDLDAGEVYISQTLPKYENGEPVLKQWPKNKKPRRISLPESVIEELRLFRDTQLKERLKAESLWRDGAHDFVFCHPDGKPYNPHRFTKRWTQFHQRHKLKPIRLHDLRHTSASWMIFKKVHSEAIAKRLGHSNAKMLEIYGHIFRSVDQAAASSFDDIATRKKKKAAEA